MNFQDNLREQLLAVMDQKDHRSWHQLATGAFTKAQLRTYYQQEWAVYVRDFPLLLARVLALDPPGDVKCRLAENLYEEATGRLSLGRPHNQLFLEMMEALGFRRNTFDRVRMRKPARVYRRHLDAVTTNGPWPVAAAVVTIFVEGSVNDRRELGTNTPSRKTIERMVKEHPLVRHYGVDPARMNLIRAHRLVEGGHRKDAYAMVLDHIRTPREARTIVQTLKRTLQLWRKYRDTLLPTKPVES